MENDSVSDPNPLILNKKKDVELVICIVSSASFVVFAFVLNLYPSKCVLLLPCGLTWDVVGPLMISLCKSSACEYVVTLVS